MRYPGSAGEVDGGGDMDLAAQAAMVAALRERLAQRLGRPVALRETHISWVLLAGDRAYKLKKALCNGFLDARSRAQRHAQCCEELRLNRRLAPGLYLDLWPVTGRSDAPLLAPPTDATPSAAVLDWAVVMRAFDEDQLWQHLVARQALPDAALDDLAQQLARWQARAPAAAAGSDFGSPARVRATEAATLQALRQLLAGRPEAPMLAPLDAWLQAQDQALAPLLRQRQARGGVREGHGDLHLGNVVQWQGRACAFDGIDFDPALRWIHTVDDIAFMAMDLRAAGRPDAAHRFVSAWVEASGDAQGLRLLDRFACHRALVRAMVALLRAGQGGEAGTPGETRDRALAQRYLDTAQALARGPGGPVGLVLMHGLSGSGKSTLAMAIVQALGAVRLRSDVLRLRLAGPGRYTPAATAMVYERLGEQAREVLASGRCAVLDATFLQRAPRQAALDLARAQGAPVCIVDLRGDPAQLRQRLRLRRARGQDPSEADETVLAQQIESAEPLDEPERALALPGPADATDAVAVQAWLAPLRRRLQAPSGSAGASASGSVAPSVPLASPFSSA